MQRDIVDALMAASCDNIEQLVIDNIVLENGFYIMATKHDDGYKFDKNTIHVVQNREVARDNANYLNYSKLDYYSKYINSNKSVASKNISSCTYLSFYVKKETFNDLVEKDDYGIVDDYFNELRDMYESLKKKDSAKFKVYDNLITDGLLKGYMCPSEKIEQHRDWIKDNLKDLKDDVDKLGKGEYVKIFFDVSEDEYRTEYMRYAIPNLFISNKYNIEVNGKIIGIPVSFYNVNSKKPYKFNRTRPIATPYLVDQKFNNKIYNSYRYLVAMSRAPFLFIKMGDNNNYEINSKEVTGSGIFLKTTNTTKGLFVDDWDIVTCSGDGEKYYIKEFINDDFNTYVDSKTKELKPDILYANYYSITENIANKEVNKKDYIDDANQGKKKLARLIDNTFFYGKLRFCCFADDSVVKAEFKTLPRYIKRNFIKYRVLLTNWLIKNTTKPPIDKFNKIALDIIEHEVIENPIKAIKQINVLMSLNTTWKGENFMGKTSKEIADNLFAKMELLAKSNDTGVTLETSDEYAFALGQLAYYVGNLSKSKSAVCEKTILQEKKSYGILMAINNVYSSGRYNDAIKLKNRYMALLHLVTQYYGANKNEELDRLSFLQGYAFKFGNVMFYKNDDNDEENQDIEGDEINE